MRSNKNILVELKNVKKDFITAKTMTGKPLKIVHAVDRINLSIYEGETIGVVGESGVRKVHAGAVHPAADRSYLRPGPL